MKLSSFFYKGEVYAILVTPFEVTLYTNRKTFGFASYYEAVDWLKHR